jgi:omega-amidase
MIISLISANIIWEEKQANLENYSRLLDCLKYKSDVFVFPEMFSTGFTMNTVLAESMEDGISVNWLRNESRKREAAFYASVPVESYNRGIFAMPDGHCVCYDKRHLFSIGEEATAYCPGDKKVIVSYGGVNFLLNICYDIRFPVWSRNVDNEYDVLLNIASFPGSRIEAAHILARARAVENQAYCLFVNRTGSDANGDYPESSIAVDYKGNEIGEGVLLKTTDNAMSGYRVHMVEIDIDKLRFFREKFPVWKDAEKFNIVI